MRRAAEPDPKVSSVWLRGGLLHKTKKHVIYFSRRKIASDAIGHLTSRLFAAVEENSVIAINVGFSLLVLARLADIYPNALHSSRIVKEKAVWEVEV